MGFLKHLVKDLCREAYYRRHHYYEENQGYDQRYHRASGAGYPGPSGILPYIKNLISRNKKIFYFLFAVFGFFLLLFIAIIVSLLPMILSVLNYLYNNGIKGIVDVLLRLLNMLWEGFGK